MATGWDAFPFFRSEDKLAMGQACIIGIISSFGVCTGCVVDNANNTSQTPFIRKSALQNCMLVPEKWEYARWILGHRFR